MKTMDKWLTITVAAYNAQKYLHRCLRSIAGCGAYLDKIEVLVVNDGSTDGTEEIAQQFAKAYPRSFFVITKKNGGHGSAINKGIQKAHGRYFLVLDADDWLDSEALVELVKTIGCMKDTLPDLISCHYSRVDLETGASTPVRQEQVTFRKIYPFAELPVSDVYFALASICYRTSLLQSMQLVIQEHTYYADVEYMLLPMPYVETVYFLDLYLYKYFVGNTEQSIYLPTMVKRYAHHNRVMHRVIDTLAADTANLSGRKKAYVWQILEKLLYTHYAISLVYDENHARGALRAKKFDAYLKYTSFALYERMEKTVPFLRIYRKYDFSVSRVQKAYGYRVYLKCLDFCKTMYVKICRIYGWWIKGENKEAGKHV